MLQNRFLFICLSAIFVSLTSLCQETKFNSFVISDTFAYRKGVTSTYADAPYLTGQTPGFTLPEAIHSQQPQYPLWELSERIDGIVILKVLIAKDGKIQRAVVEQSAHKGMSRSAIEALLQSEFKPARKDSLPIDVWMKLTYRFNTK